MKNPRLWFGFAISAVLLWWSLKDVDFAEAWRYTQAMNLLPMIPYALLMVAEVLLRALKWQVMLLPTKRCSFWKLNSATLIGLMANNILPGRAGEFVRAYAGARLVHIPYTKSFATVVLDRVLDGLTVSGIFILTIIFYPLPDQVKGWGYAAASIYLFAFIFLIALLVRERATLRFVEIVLRPFPHKLSDFVLKSARSFVEGLHVFRDPKLLLATILISFLIWAGYALGLDLIFQAFNIQLSVFDAFVVLLILTLVLTLPGPPGFVGQMEFAISQGLGLFGIDPSQAIAVALVYHVSQYVPITVAGIIAVFAERLTMSEITHVAESDTEEIEEEMEELEAAADHGVERRSGGHELGASPNSNEHNVTVGGDQRPHG